MFDKLNMLLLRFRTDRSGVTAVEYGVIALAIVVGIVALMFTLGDEITGAFQGVVTEIQSNAPTE